MEKRRIKVMFDTNILVDVLCPDGRPSSTASATVFRAVKEGLLEGEISTQSIIDAAYVASQTEGGRLPVFKSKMLELTNYVNVDGLNSFSVYAALQRDSLDFEDDALYEHAYETGCDVFLTSDKDFIKQHRGEDERIPFFTPEEFIAKLTGQTSAQ